MVECGKLFAELSFTEHTVAVNERSNETGSFGVS